MLLQGQMLAGMENPGIGGRAIPEYQLTDERLIALTASGNAGALNKLYDRYARLVFSVAHQIFHDRASAEEAVQEVFCKLWRHARDYQPERGKFSSWLIRMTQNECIDELRYRRVRPILEPIDDEAWLGVASDGNPNETLENICERARVSSALAKIPREQRTVIELSFYEGLSHPEIASRCGDPLGTVKTRLRLGLQKLRGLLAE
ncbi:MAG: sigma-70 family RNA polymerase sigma factor [Anaerolineae bacterium]